LRTRLPRHAELLAVLLGAASAPSAHGQQADPTLPPQIAKEPGPGQAQLAHVAPEKREPLEEIVVIGKTALRLPDLGSSWKPPPEEGPPKRIRVDFVPLYSAENPSVGPQLFEQMTTTEAQRIGYVELFRLRLGGR
jgi:hypothetical protein